MYNFRTSFSIVSAQIITGEHKQRAKDLVKQMTLKEKLDYIGGEDKFFIRAIPRLGIPKFKWLMVLKV